jgi:hypothetical protein
MGSGGTHPWVQLRTNPRSISGDMKILGVVLEATYYDLGGIRWDGTTFTKISVNTFSADTTAVTYECFEMEFMNFGPPNYELDLEVQWTNVDCTQNHEELCIYGGVMGEENIRVDVWNGSSWVNFFADLNSGWKNISVSSYLSPPTFTIRFKGGNETGDTTQDSWNIDATLLHIWATETYDYVLKVKNNQVADAWKVSLKAYGSSNIARISSTTISFHDGTSSDQIIVSNGIITQSEGALYDLAVSATIYIKMSNVQAPTSGTSYIYVYLKVLVPSTSTYSLFIITFEIT